MIIIIIRGENFVAHLDGLGGTPVCRGTPVAHQWPRRCIKSKKTVLHNVVHHCQKPSKLEYEASHYAFFSFLLTLSFPSLHICPHRPFSRHSQSLWDFLCEVFTAVRMMISCGFWRRVDSSVVGEIYPLHLQGWRPSAVKMEMNSVSIDESTRRQNLRRTASSSSVFV
jgi:hypothetical protein